MSEAKAFKRSSALQPFLRGLSVHWSEMAWRAARYSLAPVTTAISLLLGLGFYHEFKSIPFMAFVPAIAICTGFGGLGPGLLALGLGIPSATYLFLLEDYADSPAAQLAFFMASAAVITVLSAMLRHAYRAMQLARQQAAVAEQVSAEARMALAQLMPVYEAERRARASAEQQVASLQAKCAECPVSAESLVEELTAREVEVLRLLREGLTNARIAHRLVISPHTVNMHLRSVYAKLGVASRSAAVAHALDRRVI